MTAAVSVSSHSRAHTQGEFKEDEPAHEEHARYTAGLGVMKAGQSLDPKQLAYCEKLNEAQIEAVMADQRPLLIGIPSFTLFINTSAVCCVLQWPLLVQVLMLLVSLLHGCGCVTFQARPRL